jgi:hypothetical protein
MADVWSMVLCSALAATRSVNGQERVSAGSQRRNACPLRMVQSRHLPSGQIVPLISSLRCRAWSERGREGVRLEPLPSATAMPRCGLARRRRESSRTPLHSRARQPQPLPVAVPKLSARTLTHTPPREPTRAAHRTQTSSRQNTIHRSRLHVATPHAKTRIDALPCCRRNRPPPVAVLARPRPPVFFVDPPDCTRCAHPRDTGCEDPALFLQRPAFLTCRRPLGPLAP